MGWKVKSVFLGGVMLIGGQSGALAATTGHGALALAVIVGDYSPSIGWHSKIELARLLDDKKLGYGKHAPITVKATSVVCRAGDVDLAAFSCTLTFGTTTRTGTGRRANELFATLIEAGVPGDGAAGTIFEAIHNLDCTVEPAVLAQKNGGGVTCNFDPGPS